MTPSNKDHRELVLQRGHEWIKSPQIFLTGLSWFGIETKATEEKARRAAMVSEPRARRAEGGWNKGTSRVSFAAKDLARYTSMNNRK